MRCPLLRLLLLDIPPFYLFHNIRNRKEYKNMKKRINDLLHCSLAASFTLEAAAVFPIILAAILSIFLLVFSLHDTAAAKAISYRYLIAYSIRTQNIYSYTKNTMNSINSEIQKASIINNTSSFSLKLEKNNLKITSSSYNLPVTFSNYNNTELLWAYKAGKTLFDNYK